MNCECSSNIFSVQSDDPFLAIATKKTSILWIDLTRNDVSRLWNGIHIQVPFRVEKVAIVNKSHKRIRCINNNLKRGGIVLLLEYLLK